MRRSVFELTPAEKRTMELVKQGLSDGEIAQRLGFRNRKAINSQRNIAKLKIQLDAGLEHSHAPQSPRKAHGNSLEPFIR